MASKITLEEQFSKVTIVYSPLIKHNSPTLETTLKVKQHAVSKYLVTINFCFH